MRQMKGQTEIIIVAAVIIVAIIIVSFLFYKPSVPPPPSEMPVINSLKDDIERRVSIESKDIIDKVGLQGGYLDTSNMEAVVSFRGSNIPYWQYADLTKPRTRTDVGSEISKGVKDFVTTLDLLDWEIREGREVDKGTVQNVETTINDEEVVIKVYAPVTLDGYTVYSTAEPLTISVPVKLGKALDFANELAVKNKQERYFEWFTVSSILIYAVNGFDGTPKVPSIGILRGCGKSMHKTWWDVRPEMELLLRGFLEHTYTAGKVPAGIENTSSFPVHSLPVYTDLDANFYLGESLNEKNFQFSPNPVKVSSIVSPYIAVCLSPPYRVNYWMFYPVVGEVEDGDFKFRFALSTYVSSYKPGDFKDIDEFFSTVSSYWETEQKLCEEPLCTTRIEVKDKDGPVEFAKASFLGCHIGMTDENGILEAKIPCGIGMLELRKSDSAPHAELTSATDLENKSIHLYTPSLVEIHLYNIEFEETNGVYTAKSVSVNDKDVLAQFVHTEDIIQLPLTNSSFIVSDRILPGTNRISYMVKDNKKTLGGFIDTFDFAETDMELWVYAPVLAQGVELKGESVQNQVEYVNKLLTLSNITRECGKSLGVNLPISTSEVDIEKIKGCVI